MRFQNMDKITIPLREIARETCITADQAKYWIKLLHIAPKIKGRVGYLESNEAAQLRTMAKLVAQGSNPKEAAAKITGITDENNIVVHEKNGIEDLQKALMLIVEANKATLEENRQIKEAIQLMQQEVKDQIFKLTEENRKLRLIFEPPQISKQIDVWKPKQSKINPLQSKNWLEKIYIKIFQPEKMRQFETQTLV